MPGSSHDFQITVQELDAGALVSLAGEFDLSAAETFDGEFRGLEGRGLQTVVLDLRQLRFIDSTGLRMILQVDARSRQNGFQLAIVRGPQEIQRVFEITGMDEYLRFVDDPSHFAGSADTDDRTTT